jgi:outer membrane phospholipase A
MERRLRVPILSVLAAVAWATPPALAQVAPTDGDGTDVTGVTVGGNGLSDHPQRDAGLVEYVAARFRPFEPVYFVWGDEDPNTKFQISLKYQIFNPDGDAARAFAPLAGLFVAYTQTSFWDTGEESGPFFDSSYRPELLFQQDNLFPDRVPGLVQFDLQAGLGHESNGKGGLDSRSLNTIYIRPVLSFGDPRGRDHGWFLSVGPKLIGYLGDLDDNPEIDDLRGNVNLKLVAGRFDDVQLSAEVRVPNDLDFDEGGSLQLDLSYPLGKLTGDNFDFYLHAQLFTGFGESLLLFDERETTFRFGASFVR